MYIKNREKLVSISLRSIIHSYFNCKVKCNTKNHLDFRLLVKLYSLLHYDQKNLLLQYFFRMLLCDIFIFEIFYLFQIKVYLTPHFLDIIQLLSFF